MEIAQDFPGTKILVLVPGNKHNAVQHMYKKDAENRAWNPGGD